MLRGKRPLFSSPISGSSDHNQPNVTDRVIPLTEEEGKGGGSSPHLRPLMSNTVVPWMIPAFFNKLRKLKVQNNDMSEFSPKFKYTTGYISPH